MVWPTRTKQRLVAWLVKSDIGLAKLKTSAQETIGPPYEPKLEEARREAGYGGKLQVENGSSEYEGQLSEAAKSLDLMVQRGFHVSKSTFYSVLKRCIAQKDLVLGSRVHALAIKRGYESNTFLANQLICLYGLHGRLEEATKVFRKVLAPNRHIWASIILAHARHGQPMQAIKMYLQMRHSTVKPDNHIFVAVLKACASSENLSFGRQVHADILMTAHKSNLFVDNSLLDMYAKCGSIEDARRVFDNLRDKNVVTWTAMIAGYAQQGLGQEALILYGRMEQEGKTPPNHITFVCLLQACASSGSLHQGKQLHAQIQERQLDDHVVVGTCLVEMYIKCGSIDDARKVFNNLKSKNVVTWTAMIAGYAQHGYGQDALLLYGNMQKEGITPADAVTFVCLLQACGIVAGLEKGKEIHAQISEAGVDTADLFVANALIDMYGKCGSMVDAQHVFDCLPVGDVVTWSALITGYARHGESEVVFDLFQKMRLLGIKPNGITFLSVLNVCSHVGLLDKGQRYFEAMSNNYGITPTAEHYNCMVDLLGRAGHLDKAMGMVRTMPVEPCGEVWRSVLGACRKWKNLELGREAFECAIRSDKDDAAAYVLMANIYAAADMQEKAKEIQAMRVNTQAWKTPGQSWWTDISGRVHVFVVGDKDHPERQDIATKLGDLLVKMKKVGYVPHIDSVLRDIPDDQKEAALCGHSERLAIAHALLKTPDGTTIRVVKNLRVCEDCHFAIALISKIERRTIICRDASRFHVYKNGECSCGDYW